MNIDIYVVGGEFPFPGAPQRGVLDTWIAQPLPRSPTRQGCVVAIARTHAKWKKLLHRPRP